MFQQQLATLRSQQQMVIDSLEDQKHELMRENARLEGLAEVVALPSDDERRSDVQGLGPEEREERGPQHAPLELRPGRREARRTDESDRFDRRRPENGGDATERARRRGALVPQRVGEARHVEAAHREADEDQPRRAAPRESRVADLGSTRVRNSQLSRLISRSVSTRFS